MTKTSTIHTLTEWTKSRLDEMDAALAAIESKADAVEAGARKKADAAIADMKKRRDAFKVEVEATRERDAKAWDAMTDKLEAEWEAFEKDVDNYWDSVTDKADEYEAAFKARVAAQQKAWRATATRMKAEAIGFGAARKAEFDASVEKAETMAKDAGEKLKAVDAATKTSWSALRSALAESRAAYDEANAKAVATFKDAMKKDTAA
ncbi:hypothetical protein [Phaeovulum sp.]|uniref:hypothetical protein n=1 Tax=Phaeovulum sp. TaxID=2934796 RepID=UPI00356B407D